MRNTNSRKIALGGLFTAIICLATAYLKITYGFGYMHMGDGFVILSGVFLGPTGILSAAIGSALADLITGFGIYAPATFVIKGGVACIAWLAMKKSKKQNVSLALCFILAEISMVVGYFLYETIIYGFYGAVGQLIPTSIQGISGIIVALLLMPVLKKVFSQFK